MIVDLRQSRGAPVQRMRQPGIRRTPPIPKPIRRQVLKSGPGIPPGMTAADAFRSMPGRRYEVFPTSTYPYGSQLSGLGFSLKPPKAIRKAATAIKKAVTIKNVLKVGAVVAATALIPGALPLIAKTALGAGKLALGTGKLAVRGVTLATKFAGRNVGKAVKVFRPGGGVPGTPGTVPITEQTQVPMPDLPVPITYGPEGPQSGVPSPSAGGSSPQPYFGPGPQPFAEESAATAAPQQAGFGNAIVPLIIGGVVLFALSKGARVRRA